MSSSQTTSLKDLLHDKSGLYLQTSPLMRGAMVFCLLVGLISIVLGFINGQELRTWGSVIFNLFFFFCIALGGSVFSAMQDIIGARWGRPINRIHESFTGFLPLALSVFFVFFLCIHFHVLRAHEVYKWIADPSLIHHFWGKKSWLQENFMLIRDTVSLLIIYGLVRWQISRKTTRDHNYINNIESTTFDGIQVKNKLRYWSAPFLIVIALTFTCLCFDILKSLAPTWVSTLWGGWMFAIMMQTLMAMLLIWMFVLKNTAIGRPISQSQFHDVGKLLHGFTIFFAYLTYAHILTYWYGNVPEETEYFIHRLHAPWIYIIIGAPLFSFVLPLFALIPKMSKWTKPITMPIAFLVLTAQWFTLLVVVQPEIVDGKTWTFPGLEFGVFLGLLGLFLLGVFNFARRHPMVAVGDPLFHDCLAPGH